MFAGRTEQVLRKTHAPEERGAIHIVALIIVILTIVQLVLLREAMDETNAARSELEEVKVELRATRERVARLEDPRADASGALKLSAATAPSFQDSDDVANRNESPQLP